MRQLAVLRLLAIIVLVAAISACGGGDNNNQVGEPATVTLTPSTISLNLGEFSSVSVLVKDANDVTNLTAPVTMQSSNTAVATVLVRTQPNGSVIGLICAGTWDTAATACTPGAIGTANITATAGTITSAAAVITTHERIGRIDITAPPAACTSKGGTRQFTAVVRDINGTDITANAGPITWSSLDTTVATINASGLATAVRPGVSSISASVGRVSSPTIQFTTCLPQTISLASANVTPTETSFTLATAATKQLAVVVTDTLGTAISDIGLAFTSTVPAVATVNASGLVTAVAPGVARIVASCTPSACANGTNQPSYSNLVTVTVSGAVTSRVFATGTNATTIVPIDPATNTAGTAVNIPQISVSGTNTQPVLNSAMFSPDGARLFIGTNIGILTFDPSTNTFLSSNTSVPGRVLAVSNNGRVAVADASAVRIYDAAAGTVANTISVNQATSASFTPDAAKLFISGADGVTMFSIASTRFIDFPASPSDIAVLAQGTTAYVAGGNASTLDVMATCNQAVLTPVAGVTATPTQVESTLDGTRVYAVDNANIYEVAVAIGNVACPPSVTNTATAVNFGAGTLTARQLVVSQDGVRAFVFSDLANVLAYNGDTDVASTIPLVAGGTSALSGGVLPDGLQVYVGAAGSNAVHRIDVLAGVDAQQIAVDLHKPDNSAQAPDIVVVKPR